MAQRLLVTSFTVRTTRSLTKENKMVDVRLTYDKGLDRYMVVGVGEKYEIFKKVSTRFELQMSKQFGKTILNEGKYFTEDIMHRLDLAAETEFKYG